jgi:hypothetical protein
VPRRVADLEAPPSGAYADRGQAADSDRVVHRPQLVDGSRRRARRASPRRAASSGTPSIAAQSAAVVPPDPLNLLARDQKLPAARPDRRHLALPDGLSELDRADAELGRGVHQAERRGARRGLGGVSIGVSFFGRVGNIGRRR